jgi:hypothetical protein
LFFKYESAAAETLQQFKPRAVKPGLHRPDRAPHDLRDLLIALTLLVEQDEDDSIFFAQVINGFLDFGAEFRGIVRGAMVRRFVKVIGGFGSPRAPRNPCPAAIDRDADHPRPEGTLAVPTTQAAKDPEEDFLSHILRVVAV